jgi:hypothetical protein
MLTFEEPPRPASITASVQEQEDAARQLRARPGEWAPVTKQSSAGNAGQFAYTVRRGLRKAWLPAGEFEAVARKVDGEYRVYARFVGGQSGE